MEIRRATAINRLCMTYSCIMIISLQHCSATDILTKDSPVDLGKTLVSANQVFELGFFSPDNSTKRYLGIWFKKFTAKTIIWVANRENPLSVSDTYSSLNIGNDGNLRILDGDRNTVWSTNERLQFNKTIAKLTNNGDFCLNDTSSGSILWESFDYPGNSLLPGMKLGTNGKTQGKHLLTSWKSDDDPTQGIFLGGLSEEQPPQAFIWRDSKAYWRSGPWDGGKFIGMPGLEAGYSNRISLVPQNSQEAAYLTINRLNSIDYVWLYLQHDGVIQMKYRDADKNMWVFNWEAPRDPCDVYGICGAFAICENNKSPICDCLKGFEPQSPNEWSKSNWTKGCVRKSELLCEKNETSLASGKTSPDTFHVITRTKLPDRYHYFPYLLNTTACRDWCLGNCSCKAYAFVEGINCMAWTEDQLIDIVQVSINGEDLFLRLSYAESGEETNGGAVLHGFISVGAVLSMGGFIFCLYKWITYKRGKKIKSNSEHELVSGDDLTQESIELHIYEFQQIIAATDNFSFGNKLGEGGFGTVYKGRLDTGQHIAVKRLSVESGQGIEEFKNEILLISKLQHRNLVKLLGCCIERRERLLIYEFMTNKSLDTFLFDQEKRTQLDWATRFNIIQGIGRGLIYLHRDSRLRIIHRDLKCSNILLDEQMNPKISDFGLARMFKMTQELANTRRIVGTYGYMSPEYAIGGVISEKSDVFSYGVMLIEIISGKKNTDFIDQEHCYPLAHAWKSWNENKGIELMDQVLREYSKGLRCIHVGLLCVQDLPKDRPTMTEVVSMLTSETDLPVPKEPLFTLQRLAGTNTEQELRNMYSINAVTITMIDGR